ncbi:oligosaccharide flippase family protein [uncultured Chryseobacterium sp.]|uniref:oligosaccharide flippase family protein n=1 Tax=uncultured Chryseobacterium sp. TaxID=259322 RepID=UPI002616C301|nr:oligosaccharide flippase family protein [uncultured Chryseobacterium sp.]
MSTLSAFIKDFYRNDGFWVFGSFFVQKLLAFATTLVIVHFLSKDEFGLLSIVPAVFTMFAPFTGFGFPVTLLRYGSLLKGKEQKDSFSNTVFREGFYFQILLSALFLLVSVFFVEKYQDIFIIFVAFAVRLFGSLLMSHIPVVYRINFENRKFSVFNIFLAVIGFVLAVLGSYFWGFYGYLSAMAIHPFFSLFWYSKKFFKFKAHFYFFNKNELYRFSLYSAITNFGSELLFAADILLLSYFLTESSVALYKVAILLPSNVVFIAQSFLQSDYPKISVQSKNYQYLRNYIVQFYKIFVPVCVLIFTITVVFRNQIISVLFGGQYLNAVPMFVVLTASFLISMLLRILFGNLLSAIGKMNLVTYATLISVVVLVLLSFFLVPKFAETGMVYSMSLALTFCGVALAFLFFRELNKLK